MKLIYIAGPFSGPDRHSVELNIRAAEAAGLLVARAGGMPVCPHANTANPAFENVGDYAFWIEGTAELLRRCDAAVFIFGWQTSTGAKGEHALAYQLSKPVFYDIAALKEWLEKCKLPTN